MSNNTNVAIAAADKFSADHTAILNSHSLEIPEAKGWDIVVRNHAAATNPVDLLILSNWGQPDAKVPEAPVVSGFDGAGVVIAVGEQAQESFKVGDAVYYAGLFTRNGSFAQYTAVDSRIVGRKPSNLSFVQAATVPLTTITAVEALEESFGLTPEAGANQGTILIVNGAGGVGSIAIQYAKYLGLTVVASASRPETIEWVKKYGADFVVNHHESFKEQFEAQGIPSANYIFNCHNTTSKVFDSLVEVVADLGKIIALSQSQEQLNVASLFFKRASFGWECMFSRPLFGIAPEKQGQLLNRIGQLLEAGTLKHWQTQVFPVTVDGVKDALTAQSSNTAIGKIALNYNVE